MQFLPSFRSFRNQQKILKNIAARLCTEELYPVPIAQGFVRWLQHSGETTVNDRMLKGSGQRPQYSPYGQLHMRLGSVFDHPLFGWSNYDGNKSPKHGLWVQGYFILLL
ncbi:hypothetical protein AVEN_30605-1 [Araneus ventricosus]|uniref:Uncharacterized protein n=1 Tax=Araneus ventricosus TaxID=182803 RepID=A0A4Y2B7P4_ARAVE|nr:hypothetical protein AVEN_30605-1 [Araneus ventricosus]